MEGNTLTQKKKNESKRSIKAQMQECGCKDELIEGT